jgi:hypothetical protein
MTDNASLSDYLSELRHKATAERLATAMGLGACCAAVGVYLGPMFVGLIGLGLAVSGVSAWARLNQIADSQMSDRFDSQQPAGSRQLRLVGVLALTIAGIGGLLFLYSFAFRFVINTKGM